MGQADIMGWRPKSAVDLVVGSKLGGPNDLVARVIQNCARELAGVEIRVRNMPGSGQAIAWRAVHEAPGDGYTLTIASNMMLTNYLTGRIELGTNHFTPIALLIEDNLSLSVSSPAQHSFWKDLIGRRGEPPKRAVRVGFVGRLGNARYWAAIQTLAGLGASWEHISAQAFDTREQALHALVEEQIDFYAETAASMASALTAGTITAVAVTARDRLAPPFSDVLTLSELDIMKTFFAWRGVMGPPAMAEESIAYWARLFEEMVRHPAWQALMVKHYWNSHFLRAAPFATFLRETTSNMKHVISDLEFHRVHPVAPLTPR